VCDTWHCQCHVALPMPRVSAIIRCHCVDYDLVPIYVSMIQFSPYFCISDSILTQFFLIIKIYFFIKLKVIKYKIFTKIKYLIFILKFNGKSHFTKSFLIKKN